MTAVTGHDPAAAPVFDLMRMDRQIRRRVLRQRALPIAAWTGVGIAGLSRRGAWGWLAAGAALFGVARQLLIWRSERPAWQKSQHAQSHRRWFGRGHVDPVDAASATSFPASDAPQM